MLVRVPSYMPNFQTTHLWINMDDEIKVVEVSQVDPRCHADIWGDDVWENSQRGYYDRDLGQLTCHMYEKLPPSLVKKLAKAFPEAVYIMDRTIPDMVGA